MAHGPLVCSDFVVARFNHVRFTIYKWLQRFACFSFELIMSKFKEVGFATCMIRFTRGSMTVCHLGPFVEN